MIWNPSATMVGILSYLSLGLWSGPISRPASETERWNCRPFLPTLFVKTPPSPDHPDIRDATKALDDYFASKYALGVGIESLSVAVVTSEGILYENNFGVLRANETNSPPTTSHSAYRIASISKLFTVLQGFILEQRGVISWWVYLCIACARATQADERSRDDPVDKYLKDFKYRLDGLDPEGPQIEDDVAPITLFQLATHMSGLGRDWPAGTAANWPYEVSGGGPPPSNGRAFPTYGDVMDDLPKHHLVSYPGAYPSYSNTGVGILGLALAAASSAADGNDTMITHAELLQRDIFGPMGLNGSHFLATDENRDSIVVSSVLPEVVVSPPHAPRDCTSTTPDIQYIGRRLPECHEPVRRPIRHPLRLHHPYSDPTEPSAPEEPAYAVFHEPMASASSCVRGGRLDRDGLPLGNHQGPRL